MITKTYPCRSFLKELQTTLLDCSYETVIPDSSVQLVFEFGDGERQLLTSHGKVWISGVQKQLVIYRAGGDEACTPWEASMP